MIIVGFGHDLLAGKLIHLQNGQFGLHAGDVCFNLLLARIERLEDFLELFNRQPIFQIQLVGLVGLLLYLVEFTAQRAKKLGLLAD